MRSRGGSGERDGRPKWLVEGTKVVVELLPLPPTMVTFFCLLFIVLNILVDFNIITF